MAYTASVNLGPTIGIGITSVKLYECTGNNSGCTALTNYTNVPVSSFNPNYIVTGITDNKRWIKVEPVGACSGTTQNLQVSGFPNPTATPTPTATSGGAPSATATPTPTPSPTPTATAGAGPTPTPTLVYTALILCGGNPAAPVAWYQGSLNYTQTLYNTGTATCYFAVGNTYTPGGTIVTGIVDGCNCPTPTPTPSATPPGISFGMITGTTHSTSTDACNQYESSINKSLYLNADSTPNVGDILYTTQECSFGSEYAGDGSVYWYFLYRMGTKYAVKVGSGGTISAVVTCGAMSTATPTPTPSPTPTSAPLYGYFRSTGLANYSSLCQSPGYVTTGQWFSTGTTFSSAIAYTRVYSDTSYTPFNGGSLWYAVTQDDTFNTLTGGQFNAVQIDADGYIISTVLYNCSGGGGAGSGGQT